MFKDLSSQVISRGQLLDHQSTLIFVQKLKRNKISIKTWGSQVFLSKIFELVETVLFFKFSAAPTRNTLPWQKSFSEVETTDSLL